MRLKIVLRMPLCELSLCLWLPGFQQALSMLLLANVIPISVMEPGDQHIQDLVFDLLKHCLLWPQHQMTMDALVGGNTDVESVVLGLLSNDTDVLDVTNQPVII